MKRSFSLLALLVLMVLGGGLVYIQATGSKLLSVQSGSMAPKIKKGDLVAVNRVPTGQLAIGDVITFASPNNSKKTITHRIVAVPTPKNGGKLITKGDANPITDAPISPKFVLGKVRYNVPYAGKLIDFVRKPLGLVLIIYLPALMVVAGEVRRLGEHYRKMRPYISPLKLRRAGQSLFRQKLALGAKLTVISVIVSGFVTWPVQAMLTSNPVTLAGSSFSVVVPPCSGSNTNINIDGGGGNNTVVVNNSNNQTATSGNATGNNATSGNVSNSNCTNINITITNH